MVARDRETPQGQRSHHRCPRWYCALHSPDMVAQEVWACCRFTTSVCRLHQAALTMTSTWLSVVGSLRVVPPPGHTAGQATFTLSRASASARVASEIAERLRLLRWLRGLPGVGKRKLPTSASSAPLIAPGQARRSRQPGGRHRQGSSKPSNVRVAAPHAVALPATMRHARHPTSHANLSCRHGVLARERRAPCLLRGGRLPPRAPCLRVTKISPGGEGTLSCNEILGRFLPS